jgi:hypothetical protein
LTRSRGCVAERHYRDLKGWIEFTPDSATVAFEVPQYDRKTGALAEHKPFEGNGTYKLSRLLKEEFKPRNEQEAAHIEDACPLKKSAMAAN